MGSELNGRINSLTGGGRILNKRGAPKEACEGGRQKAVVFLCLASESKETEEDERAVDCDPSIEFQRTDHNRTHCDPGNLRDARVLPMGVLPRDPWSNFTLRGGQDDLVNGQRDSAEDVDGGQCSEAPVIAETQVCVEVLDLFSPPQEGAECEG